MNLIPDEYIINQYFTDEMKEIKELENKLDEQESLLSEMIDDVEIEDEEDDNKSLTKVRNYLKQQIKELKGISNNQEMTNQKSKMEKTLKNIEKQDKKVKQTRKDLNQKKKELDKKITEKKESLTEEESKYLILKVFKDIVSNEMRNYLNNEKRKLISIILLYFFTRSNL